MNKLSKITLSLIAAGLHSIAEAVENMALEAGAAPSTAAVADKSEKAESTVKEQSDANKEATDAKVETELDDEDDEEDADAKKKRLRKEKRLAKKAKEKAEAEAAESGKSDDDDDSFLDDDDDEKGITKDDVKEALVALAKAEGNAAAKAILTKYKAANVSQIKAGDYESVMADITEAQE